MKRLIVLVVAFQFLSLAVTLPTPKDGYVIRENTPENRKYNSRSQHKMPLPVVNLYRISGRYCIR